MSKFRCCWWVLLISVFISGCGGEGDGASDSASTQSLSPSSIESTFVSSAILAFDTFPGSIILGKPTNSAITLSVVTETDATLQVRYGTSSGIYDISSANYNSATGIPIEITLTDLQANSQYYYILRYRESSTGPWDNVEEATFSTQKDPDTEFNFAIHSDAHVGIRVRGPFEAEKADDDQYTRTLINTLAFEPDFLIDLGDTFMSEKNWLKDFYNTADSNTRTDPKEEWVQEDYVFLRSFFNKIGHSVPLFLVNGNHEGESGWEKDEQESVAIWANDSRHDLFPVPTANNFYDGSTETEPYAGKHDGYYSWTWGAALFVVLDPYWYAESKPKIGNEWAWTLGRDQYNWLNETLERSGATFKFVFLHNLVGGLNGADGLGSGRGGALYAGDWEWGGMDPSKNDKYEFDKQRPGWGKPIHDVLVDNGVNVVFHGHDHVFVREDHTDGIIYQAVPQPSLLNETDGRAIKRSNASGYDTSLNNTTVVGASGFVNVFVKSNQVTISLIETNDQISPADCANNTSCYETVYSYSIQ